MVPPTGKSRVSRMGTNRNTKLLNRDVKNDIFPILLMHPYYYIYSMTNITNNGSIFGTTVLISL